MNSRPLWVIAAVLVGVAILLGVIVSEIRNIPGAIRSLVQVRPLVQGGEVHAKKPFSLCGDPQHPHPMGGSCKNQGGTNSCALDLDSFQHPTGGTDHEADAACAVWVSYSQKSSVTITDKGSTAQPFQITFSLESESQGDDNCTSISPLNPFTNDAALSSSQQSDGSYALTMGPMKADAINCHFKMHLTRRDGTKYDPHLYGGM